MSGTERMNALSGGHTVRTSAAIAELVGGTNAGSADSGTSVGRTAQDHPDLKAKDYLA